MSGTDDVIPLPDAAGLAEALAYGDSYLQFRQRFRPDPRGPDRGVGRRRTTSTTAHGLADVAAGTPLTNAHLFRIASHSKTVTATLVLQLVEDGALRLDDTAATHLPELASKPAGALSVRELLSHSAGLFRDSSNGDFWQLRVPFPDRAELLEILQDPRAAVRPANERFKYSNIGFGLLGLILEAVSGATFVELVDRRITGPLGLANFGPELDPDRLAELAAGYSSLAYARSGQD